MAKEEIVNFGKKGEDGKIEKLGEVTLRIPETLEEAKAMWGEDVVLSKAIDSVIISAQSIARSQDNVEKAQEVLNTWVPGISRRAGGGTSISAIAKQLKGLDPAKLKEILELAGVA